MELNGVVLLVEPVAFAAGLAVLQVPVRALRKRRKHLLAALALLSAAGAVAAGGAATGWEPLDAALRAVLAAAAVYAGVRASLPMLVVAALAAAAAGTGSPALPLALGAIGLLLASLLGEDEPLVNAAAGGLIAQAVLRLAHPAGHGLTALIATVILVPILASALRGLRRSKRRKLTRWALGAAAFVVVGGGLGAVAALSAVGPLRQGLSIATKAYGSTGTAGLDSTALALKDAGRDFAQARSALDAWWALPARAVPVVGQHLKVLRAAAGSGEGLARAGEQALSAPALADVRVVSGRIPLDQLAAIEAPAGKLAEQATAARRRMTAARSAFLVPPLAGELDDQLERLADIENTVRLANRVLSQLPALLGGGGPRRYFLAMQTPVEARAGGGFMGNFGEITAVDGQLDLPRVGRQEDLLPAPGSPPRELKGSEEFLARYARFRPEENWANVNLSPDFPTDARVIAELYPQSGGAPIDGVIAVDPYALAAALKLTGPIQVPSWPVPITADNVLQILFFDQYPYFISDRDVRGDFLGAVAEGAWRALTRGDLPPLPQVVSAFGDAVRDKHIMFWSNSEGEQRLFEDMHVAGRVAPVKGDFLGLVTQNAGGNKIDYFLRREVDYGVRLGPSGQLRATARIVLNNEAPSDGVNSVLIGNDLSPPLPKGSNKLYLSFYTPWALVSGTVDGTRVDFERATELGRQVYSTAVVIPPRSTVILELELSGRLATGDTYRLDVHRQPMVAPDDVRTTLTLDADWLGTLTGPEEHKSTLRLESDATVEVSIGRG